MALEKLFPGEGEMVRRMRDFDWRASPLGSPAGWPQSLVTAVHICLTSRFPIVLWWGKDLRLLYNDAWRPVLGRTKHPGALGSPGREVWPEIWHIIGPMLEGVLAKGEATWSDDQLLPLDRNGYLEEAYFTYSYSPIPDERGGVGGVFAAVNETTLKVLAERRLRTLRELAAQTLQAKGAVEAARMAMATLAANASDVPFALLYLVEPDGRARLEQSSPAGVEWTDGRWPVAGAIERGEPILMRGLQGRIGRLPSPWPVAPDYALVLPLRSAAQGRVLAVLVLGVNPARELDEEHRGFLDMAARHIANSVANASAYEEERRRAEALAELDRAKTAFFSNVSHEFRTPLTLMLGPVEDILAKPPEEVLPPNRAALEIVHRNGQRLLKLVNTLLDFARIEAGRAQASYEPTDLAAFTAELAANFRSACERAGLRLVVDCPPDAEPAYVDREMWEKIVLNLLSNAFKFTFEGEIAVSLRRAQAGFELAVHDTGTGIPAESLPRMFERFHRVEGARGRSHEGSGIGLALVQELVKLHGGAVRAESVLGRGSAFTVSIPRGSAHLPPERIRAQREALSTATRAGAFVDEALSWLPGKEEAREPTKAGARVLIADDNADLRDYVRRLLAEHYEVEAVADGETALAAARARRPDVVVTDVMMPRLDGFGLIRELRADPALRQVPVIALSARAGEEARVEGLGRGADDYLTKPFSGRELLVRVGALLRSVKIRRDAEAGLREGEERLRLALEAGRLGSWEWHVPSNRVTWSADLEKIHGLAAGTFPGTFEAYQRDIHPEDREHVLRCVGETLRGRDHHLEYRIVRPDGSVRWVEGRGRLFRDERGEPLRVVGVCSDITERKQAEEAMRSSEERLRAIVETTPECVKLVARDGTLLQMNAAGCGMVGAARAEQVVGGCIYDVIAPQDRERFREFNERICSGERGKLEFDIVGLGGVRRHMETHAVPLAQPGGGYAQLAITRDVTERKRAESVLYARARQQQAVASLGELALRERDLQKVFERASAAVAETLQVEYCKVLELLPGGKEMLLRAGVGWKEGMVGGARVGTGMDSQAGYTLASGTPVIVRELRTEQRFRGPALLTEHGVVSGMSCIIRGADGAPWGVLGTHATRLIEFTGDDVSFLTAVANILGHAIQRERAEAALRESDRRKDEFIAMLSHELRNPLAPLRSGLDILRLRPAGGDEQVRAMMERQVNHLVRLVDDLLETSRISRGLVELRRETVQVADVLRSAVEAAEPLVREAGHRLEVDLPREPLWVRGDAVRLSQSFANLLNNAARYTPRGGRIWLRATREPDGTVRVSVRDTGAGFAPQAKEQMFEMFSRGEGSSGLGIGLALVRKLVEMHGGSVEARSEGEGRGAEFLVRLPLAQAPAGAARQRMLQAEGNSYRILVADDNRDAAETLAMLLRTLGNEVSVAYDGVEAVEAAREFRPHIALLDIGMPRLDGYDAAREIRRQPAGERVRLVALTGWGQEEDRRRAREAGFDSHLVKPAELDALRRVLAEVRPESLH